MTEQEYEGEPAYRPAPPREETRQRPAWVDPVAEYDALWRKRPSALGFMQFCRALPGYAAQFHKVVPDEFFIQVATDAVEVACPCGETPRCRWNVPAVCACGRVFAYLAGAVHVARAEPALVDYGSGNGEMGIGHA